MFVTYAKKRISFKMTKLICEKWKNSSFTKKKSLVGLPPVLRFIVNSSLFSRGQCSLLNRTTLGQRASDTIRILTDVFWGECLGIMGLTVYEKWLFYLSVTLFSWWHFTVWLKPLLQGFRGPPEVHIDTFILFLGVHGANKIKNHCSRSIKNVSIKLPRDYIENRLNC